MLTEEQVFRSDAIMTVNCDIGVSLPVLMRLVRALEQEVLGKKEPVATLHRDGYWTCKAGKEPPFDLTSQSVSLPVFLHPQGDQWIGVKDRLPEPLTGKLNQAPSHLCYLPDENNLYGGVQMILFYGHFEWYDDEGECPDADEDGMVKRFGWHYERDSEGDYDSLTFDMNGKVSHWMETIKPPTAKEQANAE